MVGVIVLVAGALGIVMYTSAQWVNVQVVCILALAVCAVAVRVDAIPDVTEPVVAGIECVARII